MTVPLSRRRGQPAWTLASLLVGWVLLRWLTWVPMALSMLPPALHLPHVGTPLHSVPPAVPIALTSPQPPRLWQIAPQPPAIAAPRGVTISAWPKPPGIEPAPGLVAPVSNNSVRVVSAHAMLWMAAISNLPLPPGMMAAPAGSPPPLSSIVPAQGTRRWSMDGWLLVRPEGGSSGLAGPQPTYGASQIGAVVRYRLASGGMRPAAYLRATAALVPASSGLAAERGLAAGISLRPLASVPARIMAEVRADRFADGKVHARAAVFAVTEVAPITLPDQTRAEFYAQAGYVTGPAATGFADGQLRIDHRLGLGNGGELRAGAGIWGGAQRGTSRLDVGPTATIAAGTGAVNARVALDWRFRVAGNASPASGPALTISAGF